MSLLDDIVRRCERCDRETDRVIESIGMDNRPHYSCWDCVAREEKRFNQKPGWRRAHRARRYERQLGTRASGVLPSS